MRVSGLRNEAATADVQSVTVELAGRHVAFATRFQCRLQAVSTVSMRVQIQSWPV